MHLHFEEIIERSVTQNTLSDILTVLFTPSELIEFQRRVQILQLLSQGKTQREVAKHLGVGIATVTRGAKQVHTLSNELKVFFKDM